MMKREKKAGRGLGIAAFVLGAGGLVVALGWFLAGNELAVLAPAGQVASEQRELMIIATLLGLLVVVPVLLMTFFIVWRYRDTNKKPKKYRPDWDNSRLAESLWWGIPILIILVLSVITWRSSHDLDPYKAIASDKKTLTIQVVALEWKWLFLYPEEGIASVNFVQFPEDRPVKFEITADAPMNSFWIPKLAGQIYAMAGMTSQLHVQADAPGSYRGSSANLSGAGFAGMTFEAKASTAQDFAAWVVATRKSGRELTQAAYDELAKPSKNQPTGVYASAAPNLYASIIDKYLMPGGGGADERTHHPPETIEPSVDL